MGAKMLRRMLLIAGAGVMLAAMVAVMPATATAASPAPPVAGPNFTFRTFDVPGSIYTDILGINNLGVIVGQYCDADAAAAAGYVCYGFIAAGNRITVQTTGPACTVTFSPSGTATP